MGTLRNRVGSVAALAALLCALGCTSVSGPGAADGGPTAVDLATGVDPTAVQVTGAVAERLEAPWGVAFLPDGTALVGERDTGQVQHLTGAAGSRARVAAGSVPGVVAAGEGGLLGLAVSPGFAQDHWVYAHFTAAADNRVVRMRWENNRLGAPETVLAGLPKGNIHNGGRIAFGPDGYLYVGSGETGSREIAQDRNALGGKILRVTGDGSPAPGNPWPGSPVYSIGHRNVQGLAWDGQGRLWASEFGQDTWDELNLIRPGGNYGWPVVEGRTGRAGFVDPVAQWHPADASPSGLAYWQGSLWMAGLRGARLWQIPLDPAGRAGTPVPRFAGKYGRLRTVVAAPDGSLWLSTSNTDGRGKPAGTDDRILRIVSA